MIHLALELIEQRGAIDRVRRMRQFISSIGRTVFP